MRNVDGRQTRPANDVGRPDGGAERAAIDGGPPGDWPFAAGTSHPALALHDTFREAADAAAEAFFAEIQEAEASQRLGGSKAPYGEAPPDAEA
jgi:hypothetical protein